MIALPLNGYLNFMKKLTLLFLLSSIAHIKAQNIVQVKDTFINQELHDSLFSMDMEKIIPYEDSGVLVLGYLDSLISGAHFWGLKVIAMDKNLNILWHTTLPFNSQYALTPACVDKDGNTYIGYYNQGYFDLLKLNRQGQIVFDKPVSNKIASIAVVNNMAVHGNRLILQGSVYNSQTSFAPFVAIYGEDGSFFNKKILPACTSTSSGGLYRASEMVLTKENNICFTYQKDVSDNYGISCYDSSLTLVWEKTFNHHLGYTYNLFRQGNTVTFMEVADDGSGYVTAFIYNSLTGETIADGASASYTLNTEYPAVVIPTRDGHYITLGNSLTTNGFDLAMDCFDLDKVITSHLCNTNNSRNRISDACMVGNYIYTVTLRFIDQYTQNGSYYRGSPWIRKFSTDFIGYDLELHPLPELKDAKLYPNPATDVLTVDLPSVLNGHLQLCDEVGRVLYEMDFRDQKILTFDIPASINGIVLVKIDTPDGQLTKTVVIR